MKSGDEEHLCHGECEEGKEERQAPEDHPPSYPSKVLHPDPGLQCDILQHPKVSHFLFG